MVNKEPKWLSSEQTKYLKTREALKEREKELEMVKKEQLKEKTERSIISKGFKQADVFLKKEKPLAKVKFVAPQLSRTQSMMQEMFGHKDPMWGTGNNLPQFNGALMSGNGLIKSGDRGRTGSLFGIRR